MCPLDDNTYKSRPIHFAVTEKRQQKIDEIKSTASTMTFDKWNALISNTGVKTVLGKWRKRAQANQHLEALKKEVSIPVSIVAGYCLSRA